MPTIKMGWCNRVVLSLHQIAPMGRSYSQETPWNGKQSWGVREC